MAISGYTSRRTHQLITHKNRPQVIPQFLDSLVANSNFHELRGVVLVSETSRFEQNALLVLEQQIGNLGDKPIYRYHILNNWNFDYWKSRAHLAACVATAWARKLYISGRQAPISDIRRVRDGFAFLDYHSESALPMAGRAWYPEDLAIKPSTFLDGLDTAAQIQGLNAWLQLEALGLMETGLPYKHVRSCFERALQTLEVATACAQ